MTHHYHHNTMTHHRRRLTDKAHEGFVIKVAVELWLPDSTSVLQQDGTVAVIGNWPNAAVAQQDVTLRTGHNRVTLTIPASETIGVKLWNPRGHGNQNMYAVNATYTPTGHPDHCDRCVHCDHCDQHHATAMHAVASSVWSLRRVGFRHVALVTVNDTDPAVAKMAAAADGTGGLTMFFRINGAAVYARGGNKVPMDLMEGRRCPPPPCPP